MTSRRTFRLRLLGVVLCGVLAVAVVIYFLSLSGFSPFRHATFTLRAVVPSAVTLADNADVREAGVKIGSVQGVSIEGDNALVTMSIDKRYGPVYRDAQALIAGKSLAGENFVDLSPGIPAAGRLPDGGTLPLANDPAATQLDQILSTFDPQRRRDLQQILDLLSTGLSRQGGNLNGFLAGTSALVHDAAPTTGVLAADRAQVAALIDDFGVVAQTLGARGQQIQTLVHAARIEAAAIAARDQQVRATLDVLPGFLAQAHTTISRLGSFSTGATPVLRDLRLATIALLPAVDDLRPAAAATAQTIHALGGFTRVAVPAVPRLQAFASAAVALVPPLEAVLREVDPMLVYLAPYAVDLGQVFSGARAATEAFYAPGHYGRLNVTINQASLPGLLSPAEQQALQALTGSGILSVVGGLQQNAYPKPGTAGHPVPFSGSYPRIQPDPPFTK